MFLLVELFGELTCKPQLANLAKIGRRVFTVGYPQGTAPADANEAGFVAANDNPLTG